MIISKNSFKSKILSVFSNSWRSVYLFGGSFSNVTDQVKPIYFVDEKNVGRLMSFSQVDIDNFRLLFVVSNSWMVVNSNLLVTILVCSLVSFVLVLVFVVVLFVVLLLILMPLFMLIKEMEKVEGMKLDEINIKVKSPFSFNLI